MHITYRAKDCENNKEYIDSLIQFMKNRDSIELLGDNWAVSHMTYDSTNKTYVFELFKVKRPNLP